MWDIQDMVYIYKHLIINLHEFVVNKIAANKLVKIEFVW